MGKVQVLSAPTCGVEEARGPALLEERWGSRYQSLKVTFLGTGKFGALGTQCTVNGLIFPKEQRSVDLLEKLIQT